MEKENIKLENIDMQTKKLKPLGLIDMTGQVIVDSPIIAIDKEKLLKRLEKNSPLFLSDTISPEQLKNQKPKAPKI